MDDPVSGEHIEQAANANDKDRRWRSRLVIALLVLVIFAGYMAMFLAFDFWYRK